MNEFEYWKEFKKLDSNIEDLLHEKIDKVEYEGFKIVIDPDDKHFIIKGEDRDYHCGLIDQTAHTVLGLLGHLRPDVRRK